MTDACAPLLFVRDIAASLDLAEAGVAAVIGLLQEKATVPFIARYRKEMTGGLDEVAIRAIEERLHELSELCERRITILAEIDKQGKLTKELRAAIERAASKRELEDLYLPYRPKRRTRAQVARERGLLPLAMRILEQPAGARPDVDVAAFVDAAKDVASAEDAWKGARDILAEMLSDSKEARSIVRHAYEKESHVGSRVSKEFANKPSKFEQYYDFSENFASLPAHRFLAMQRGEAEGVLKVSFAVDAERLEEKLLRVMGLRSQSPYAGELKMAVQDGYKRLLAPSVESDARAVLRERLEREAVRVFAENLKHLLLAPPVGTQPIIGVDPGIRTGCKFAVLDATGKFIEHTTLYLSHGEGQLADAKRSVLSLVARHKPYAFAVGNGTAGRETEAFLKAVLKDAGKDILVVAVSESGASVYSASDVAREEFPDLDLTIRGAISIGRRLQDPLSELVKVEPKAIGVGQYQHDVTESLLSKRLGEVVETCVNSVGVELNTASAPLLSYVAGLGPSLAKKIVKHREEKGEFKRRRDLLKVPGLGAKTFEQCAGFLRVQGSDHPLDRSAVHPERYELVERMAKDEGMPVASLVGRAELIAKISVKKYLSDGVGEPTLRDILLELEKPGRDPRRSFQVATFLEGVSQISDLREGMVMQGVVTNVTAFGAFVDIGVHQDGLVHVSELADRFVRDPAEVVSVGQTLTVRVKSVDLERKRIGLTAKSSDASRAPRETTQRSSATVPQAASKAARPSLAGLLGDAMKK